MLSLQTPERESRSKGEEWHLKQQTVNVFNVISTRKLTVSFAGYMLRVPFKQGFISQILFVSLASPMFFHLFRVAKDFWVLLWNFESCFDNDERLCRGEIIFSGVFGSDGCRCCLCKQKNNLFSKTFSCCRRLLNNFLRRENNFA